MRAVVWEAPGQLDDHRGRRPGAAARRAGHPGGRSAASAAPTCTSPTASSRPRRTRSSRATSSPAGSWPAVPGFPATGAEGARVAVDPSLFCGHCPACRAGRGNLCANWNAIGDTVNGAFAEYVAVPAVNAYRIPDSVDDATGRAHRAAVLRRARAAPPRPGPRPGRAADRRGHDGPAAAPAAQRRGRPLGQRRRPEGGPAGGGQGRRRGQRRRGRYRARSRHLRRGGGRDRACPPRSRRRSARSTGAAGC